MHGFYITVYMQTGRMSPPSLDPGNQFMSSISCRSDSYCHAATIQRYAHRTTFISTVSTALTMKFGADPCMTEYIRGSVSVSARVCGEGGVDHAD